MKTTLPLMVVLCLTTMNGRADDQPLGKPFQVTAGLVANTCEKHQIAVLLVRVLPDGRGLAIDQQGDMLNAIETQLQLVLSGETRQVKILDRGKEDFAKGVLSAEEAGELLQAQQGNALLTADYLEKKSASTLRLAFFTPEGMQWVKRIRIDQPKEEQPQVAVAPQIANPNQPFPQKNGNGLPNPNTLNQLAAAQNLASGALALNVPPTMSGSSGYQFTRSGASQNSEDNSNPSTNEKTEDLTRGTGTGTGLGNGTANVSELNGKVLQFALDNLGKQVGNGQCWTLAAQALVSAGAQPPQGYVFGKEINVKSIHPGSILQFKRARFDYPNSYALLGMPDHTAIVEAVNGTTITILHQNFGQKIVTRLNIDFQNMTTGQVWAYQPVGN